MKNDDGKRGQELIRPSGSNVARPPNAGKLDVQRLVGMQLQSLEICRPFKKEHPALERSYLFHRNSSGELIASYDEVEKLAKGLLPTLPDRQLLETALESVNTALSKPCDQPVACLLIAALLDSFSQGKPGDQSANKLGMMVLAVQDIGEDEPIPVSGEVLAAAILHLTRNGSGFCPSPPELVQACRLCHKRLMSQRTTIWRLLKLHNDIASLLDEVPY